MRRNLFLLGALCLALNAGAQTPPAKAPAKTAAGPAHDLRVELRQIEEGGGGYSVGTAPDGPPLLTPQQVQVRNGERATLRLGQSIPVQWTSSVNSYNASLTIGDATANASGGGARQELMWLEAGQALSVRPRWGGGRQPVTLEVEVQSASVDPHAGAAVGGNLPVQERGQLVTVVTAPLGTWVTIASSGAAPAPGVYSSVPSQRGRRLLQLRVQTP